MSCLLMGLGHPTLLPGGWTRLGLFPAPLCLTPRPGLACLPTTLSLPSAWRAGAWDSARGALGLLTHRLGAPAKLWVRSSHDTCSGGPEVKHLLQPLPVSMATAHSPRETLNPTAKGRDPEGT